MNDIASMEASFAEQAVIFRRRHGEQTLREDTAHLLLDEAKILDGELLADARAFSQRRARCSAASPDAQLKQAAPEGRSSSDETGPLPLLSGAARQATKFGLPCRGRAALSGRCCGRAACPGYGRFAGHPG